MYLHSVQPQRSSCSRSPRRLGDLQHLRRICCRVWRGEPGRSLLLHLRRLRQLCWPENSGQTAWSSKWNTKLEVKSWYLVKGSSHSLLTSNGKEDSGHGEVEVDGDVVICVGVEYPGCLLQQLNSLLYCCWLQIEKVHQIELSKKIALSSYHHYRYSNCEYPCFCWFSLHG